MIEEDPKMYPTLVSDVIRELQEVLEKYGDIPCGASSTDNYLCTKIEVQVEPKYYDGGCLHPLDDTDYHVKHWQHSRKQSTYLNHCLIEADGPLIHIEGDKYPDDTIDGEPLVRVIDTYYINKEGKTDFIEPDSYALGKLSSCVRHKNRASFDKYHNKYYEGYRTINDMRYLRHILDFIRKQSDSFKKDFEWDVRPIPDQKETV